MNIIDIIVILGIIFSAYIGMRKGFVRSLVAFVGIVIVFILAYFMKNPIADWLCLNLPFFNFTGSFKGATILNVIFYQIIAFIIMFSLLMVAYHVIVRISGLVERLLKTSFILAVPTKIGGLIVGILEGIVISLIAIVILSLPVLKFDLIENSAIRNYLYNVSPVIGNITGSMNESVDEILELKEKINNKENKEEFNLSSLDIMLKHKAMKVSLAEKLVNSGKLNINSDKAMEIVNKYK
jgi:uncharacterized membrane protein required for colicin V production